MESINKRPVIGAAIFILILIFFVTIAIFNMNDNKIDIEEQLSLGEKYLLEHDYENAIIAFNKVINIDPMNVRAYSGLVDVYIGLGDIDKAVDVLEKGIKTIPDMPDDFEMKLRLLKLNTISFEDYVSMNSIHFDICEEIIELFKLERFNEIPEFIRNKLALPIRDSIPNNSKGEIMYYGDVEDGKPQGLGICVYSKEIKETTEAYVGEFKNGMCSGIGLAIFTWSHSQGYYIGEWNDDNVHGRGEMYEDYANSDSEVTGFDGILDQFSKGVTNNGNAEGFWLEGWYDNGEIVTEDGDNKNGTDIAGYQYYCVDGKPTSMGKVSDQAWWVDTMNDEENIIGSNLMAKAYIVYNDGTEVFREAPHEHAGGVNCIICRKFYENYESGNGQVNYFHSWQEDLQSDRQICFGFHIE